MSSSTLFLVHPRAEGSVVTPPWRTVTPSVDGTEAVQGPGPTVTDFLLSYDWRGRNQYQEEENLEFLHLYTERWPQVGQAFLEVHGGLPGRTEWEE